MTARPSLPRTVWVLGFVSLLMDTSSEMIHALLPLFLVGTLGVSVAVVGLIEGVSEATAAFAKLFSGWFSDRSGKRKPLVLAGYGLAALTKPVFPLASTALEVMGARFADRIGKGLRGAPRDALIADVTPPAMRGAAFGLRQSLDTIGAVAGPLLAIGLMAALAGDIRAVFAWAVVPAAGAVVLIVFGVEEPSVHAAGARPGRPRLADARRLGAAFWAVIAVGLAFTLARFSEAFLILRASSVGFSLLLAPMAMVMMNVIYAIVSAPAGRLSDRLGRGRFLAVALIVLVVADAVLALAPSRAGVLVGAALWGLHMGLSQGLLSALVADAAPADLRGTAFGVFNLTTGLAMLAASALAGLLWTLSGPAATFLAGGGFALAALAGVLLLNTAFRRP